MDRRGRKRTENLTHENVTTRSSAESTVDAMMVTDPEGEDNDEGTIN